MSEAGSLAITTRPVEPTDVEGINRVLMHCLISPITHELMVEELGQINDGIAAVMHEEIAGKYFVAIDYSEEVVGLMGVLSVSQIMQQHILFGSALELVNAYVGPNQRGKGIGSKLISDIELAALQMGAGELLVNSGPYYEATGWKFFNKHFGEPIAMECGIYGEKIYSPIWRKILEEAC